MALTHVEDVADAYRLYVDEDDDTWLSEAHVATALSIGEDEFWGLVSTVDPHYRQARQEITVSGRSYDLAAGAIKLLGASANPRMSRLLKVAAIGSAGQYPPDYFFRGAATENEFHQTADRYMLNGTTLYFNKDINGLVRLHYTPVSTVDWTKQTAGDNEWISDLVEYHDLIALLAVAQYSVRDLSSNAEVDRLLARRKFALETYLRCGRAQEMTNHVAAETY